MQKKSTVNQLSKVSIKTGSMFSFASDFNVTQLGTDPDNIVLRTETFLSLRRFLTKGRRRDDNVAAGPKLEQELMHPKIGGTNQAVAETTF